MKLNFTIKRKNDSDYTVLFYRIDLIGDAANFATRRRFFPTVLEIAFSTLCSAYYGNPYTHGWRRRYIGFYHQRHNGCITLFLFSPRLGD